MRVNFSNNKIYSKKNKILSNFKDFKQNKNKY